MSSIATRRKTLIGTAGGLFAAMGAGTILLLGAGATAPSPPPPPPSSGFTANVYVNTSAGGSPSRCGTACDYVAANAYGSFVTACAAATAGDKIGVHGGTYPAQTLTTATCNPGSTTYFVADGVGTVTISGGSLFLGTNTCAPNTPSNLSFDGINIAEGKFQNWANCPGANPTNLAFKNARIYCNQGCDGGMDIRSVNGFTATNVELGPFCCQADASNIKVDRSDAANSSNITFDRVYIHDAYDSCTHEQAALTAVYPCAGTGFGDPSCSGCTHVDGIHSYGCNTCTIKNSRIYAVNPTSSSSTGSAQSIFFQQTNTDGFSNLWFYNNVVTCGCGTNTFSMGGPGTSYWSGYLRFDYNSVAGNGIKIYDSVGSRILAPGTTVRFAGNIYSGLVHDTGSTSCTFIAGDGSTITPTYRNNLGVSNTCDASDRSGAPTWTSTNFYTPDLHLIGAAQTADNAGESTYCPATDIDGQARPIGAACDIGADER